MWSSKSPQFMRNYTYFLLSSVQGGKCGSQVTFNKQGSSNHFNCQLPPSDLGSEERKHFGVIPSLFTDMTTRN